MSKNLGESRASSTSHSSLKFTKIEKLNKNKNQTEIVEEFLREFLSLIEIFKKNLNSK